MWQDGKANLLGRVLDHLQNQAQTLRKRSNVHTHSVPK